MLKTVFSADQLIKILEQAAIHDCACPAQICKEIRSLRSLYDYQAHCLNLTETDKKVHESIALSVSIAHAEMEHCLEDVLALEGWNRQTLEMPEGLQKRLLSSICADDTKPAND
jgi:hypothetical protein